MPWERATSGTKTTKYARLSHMASIWTELRRRNVVRVGFAYGLVCWVLLQIADFALGVIEAPGWILQVLVLIAAIGLPAVMVFAWVYEMTPEGLKLESEVDRSQSVTADTGRRLNAVIVTVLVVAVGFFGVSRFLEPFGLQNHVDAVWKLARNGGFENAETLHFVDDAALFRLNIVDSDRARILLAAWLHLQQLHE